MPRANRARRARASVVRFTSLVFVLTSATAELSAQPATQPRPAEVARDDRSAGRNSYIEWLEAQSMLAQARALATRLSGHGEQWQHTYASPEPRELVQKASVWVLGYPGSVITRPDESVIATWGDPALWKAFDEIGIDLLHTGPVKRSGGIVHRTHTPTVDGWFDRISLEIDPALGSEAEYRRMVEVAGQTGALIAGDLVPLHTGKGADFLLALRAHEDYPGLYALVEIRERDWPLLPSVDDAWSSALVSNEVAEQLTQRGYLPGRINSADADPQVRSSSGWSATGPVEGTDGRTRRWVYLHFFKPGQPVLNWMDPSCTAQQMIAGDVVRTIHDLGARVVRLDAVPFIGIEPGAGSLTWHYQHPLSVLDMNYLAFMTRRLGGWSFQELNVPLPALKQYMELGPDLSYDFFTRAECLHALLIEDAALLRQAHRFLLEAGIQPLRLVHDLQNHDEITYQLVPLDFRGDELLEFEGQTITGRQLRERTLAEMRNRAAGRAAPYNLLYRPTRDGLATTYAGFVAACIGVQDLDRITTGQAAQIRRGHLLIAMANAMQPGVFSLSSWDLAGALPLEPRLVEDRMKDADYRWVNRGGVDLLGVNPQALNSSFGLPRARSLYGSLPEQLRDPASFSSQLKRMLAARRKWRIHEGELVAVPDVSHSAVCLLVMRVPGPPAVIVTALNFDRDPVSEPLDFGRVAGLDRAALADRRVLEVISGDSAGTVGPQGILQINLEGRSGKVLCIQTAGTSARLGNPARTLEQAEPAPPR